MPPAGRKGSCQAGPGGASCGSDPGTIRRSSLDSHSCDIPGAEPLTRVLLAPCSTGGSANLEMRDSDPKATLEADWKVSEKFLKQTTLQQGSYEMYQQSSTHSSSRTLQPGLATISKPCSSIQAFSRVEDMS